MNLIESLRRSGQSAFQAMEREFDGVFGQGGNPLRHLGALGMMFFWILGLTGIYLYIVLDTGIQDVYDSVLFLTREQWWLGGLFRSLHRYSADALVIVMFLHLVREFLYGRFRGARWWSWVTGVLLIGFVYGAGVDGLWLPWDQLAQYSAIATAEWLDVLPLFEGSIIRNFLFPGAMNDRFFTLIIFIHIAVPLFMLIALWAHVQRISRVDWLPPRPLRWSSFATLVLLCLVLPVGSHAQADLARAPGILSLDWFYLFIHPLMDATSPAFLWWSVTGVTLALLMVPLLPAGAPPVPVAQVDPPNCNGCARCFDDCPYSAIVMVPHPTKPGHRIAEVNEALCTSCGICAGACPSSTPFRRAERLVTGIDMPQQPVTDLRQELETALARFPAGPGPKIVVFGCDHGAPVGGIAGPRIATFSLLCTGMVPPSFIEYALRGGADGVIITGCRGGGCLHRLGNLWTDQRIAGVREPHLRGTVPQERIRIVWADRQEKDALSAAVEAFAQDIEALGDRAKRPQPYSRRIKYG